MNERELYHHGIKGQKWGIRRYQNPDGTLTALGKKREKEDIHEDYKKVHDKKSVKYMSDAELQNRNKRLQMEKQYQNMTKKTNKGKKIVTTLIATAGTITALEGAYNIYKRIGNSAIDKIGDWIISDLNKGFSRHL